MYTDRERSNDIIAAWEQMWWQNIHNKKGLHLVMKKEKPISWPIFRQTYKYRNKYKCEICTCGIN